MDRLIYIFFVCLVGLAGTINADEIHPYQKIYDTYEEAWQACIHGYGGVVPAYRRVHGRWEKVGYVCQADSGSI